jgi:hypothetical protein
MFIRVAILLAVLAVAAGKAQSLRREAEAVPLDNVRGGKVLQRLHKRALDRGADEIMDKMWDHPTIKAARAAAQVEAKHGRNLQSNSVSGFGGATTNLHKFYPGQAIADIADLSWSDVVLSGSLVQRYRPNSDCSGRVVDVFNMNLGYCRDKHEGEGIYNSIQFGALEKDGMVSQVVGFFGGAGCKGQPFWSGLGVGE